MTAPEVATLLSFSVAAAGAEPRQVTGVYCCDLLSVVMGRAPADSAWVTVMGNLNAVAVAVLTDVACIVVAEGMPVDADTLERARQQGVAIFQTQLPVFEAATAIRNLLP